MAPAGWQRGDARAAAHTRTRTRHLYSPIVLFFFFPCGIVAKDFVNKFSLCNTNLQPVLNGNSTFMGMDKAAMQERGYLYTDWPKELPRDTSYPREKYITLTYSGSLS